MKPVLNVRTEKNALQIFSGKCFSFQSQKDISGAITQFSSSDLSKESNSIPTRSLKDQQLSLAIIFLHFPITILC